MLRPGVSPRRALRGDSAVPPLPSQADVLRSGRVLSSDQSDRVVEGDKSREHCRDGSDQKHCDGPTFTGCFLLTDLGLRISSWSQCFCYLASARSKDDMMMMPSPGVSFSSSNVRGTNKCIYMDIKYMFNILLGSVCLSRSSEKICDGTVDCIGGEDEHSSFCGHRNGRKLSLDLDHDNFLYEQESFMEENQLSGNIPIILAALATVSMALLSLLSLFLYKRKIKRSASKDFISIELSHNQY